MDKVQIVNLDEVVNNSVAVQEANTAIAGATSKAAEAESSADIAVQSRIDAENAASIAVTKADEVSSARDEVEVMKEESVAASVQAGNYRDDALNYLASMNIKYDEFDDRYLGAKASDPATDNDGLPLLEGAMYWNTAIKGMKVYNGVAWVEVAAAAGALLTANELSDIVSKANARDNLDVYSRGETTAQFEPKDSTILKDADIGVTIQGYNVDTVIDSNYVHTDNNYTTAEKAKLADTYTKSETDTNISNAVSGLIDSSPETLDTLNELAAALGDDPDFATTVATSIGTKVSKAGDTMTGDLTVPNVVVSGLVDGRDVSVDGTKLDGIESGATGDQTATEIETLYEGISNTNKYTDAEKTKLANTEITSQLDARDTANRNTDNHTDGTTNGVYTLAERTKLAGIESAATADQTGAEIKALYEAELDTNAYTDSEKTLVDVGTTMTTTATTLTGAVNELDAAIDTHIVDTVGAHEASAISVTPNGNLSSTNVQLGLEELQSKIDTINEGAW